MTNGGEGAPGRLYSHVEETKQKISKSLTGIKRTAETIEKMKSAKSGKNHPFYGKTHSAEAKASMSANRKDKPKPRVTCPYCNKEGGASTMKRYHFEYCKELVKT
jgi:hypothetical protein